MRPTQSDEEIRGRLAEIMALVPDPENSRLASAFGVGDEFVVYQGPTHIVLVLYAQGPGVYPVWYEPYPPDGYVAALRRIADEVEREEREEREAR